MRILHITTYLQGGAGRVIADLAIRQRQAGHDVIVVSDSGSQPGYASYPEYLGDLHQAGVELHVVRSTFAREVPLNVDAAGDLSRLIGNRQVDIVHAHAAIPAMVARLACGSGGTPIVVTMHGWGIAKTPEQVRTDATLLSLADAVVTPSAALRTRLRSLGIRQKAIAVVPYGIAPASVRAVDDGDVALFESIRSQGDRVVICVGTIGERKNQRLLVRALAYGSLGHVQAVFIGDGESTPLRNEASFLGIGARVHVLGHRADASRYLRYADVVVLPSREEGLPLVVLEALRDGVPIVASDIPEVLEALGGGRLGYVFASGSETSLADVLGHELSRPGSDRSTLALEQQAQWRRRHRLEQMTAAYDAIYTAQAVARVRNFRPGERIALRRPA